MVGPVAMCSVSKAIKCQCLKAAWGIVDTSRSIVSDFPVSEGNAHDFVGSPVANLLNHGLPN